MTELAHCAAWITRGGERTQKCTSKAVQHEADQWVDLCRIHVNHAKYRFEKDLRKGFEETMSDLVQKNLEIKNQVLKSLMEFSSILTPQTGGSSNDVRWMSDSPRYVYFIGCQDYIKIGCSVDPRERLKNLKESGNGTKAPRGIDLWDAKLLRAEPGTLNDETALHKKFAHLRAVGEWFRAEDELLEYIDHLEVAA